MRAFDWPFRLRPMYGKLSPAKFEPPPAQASTTSGSSPARAICSMASNPITVWCSITWFSTEPSAYFVSASLDATSTASLMAMPSEPGVSGCAARIARPDSVSMLGLAVTLAP